MCCVNDPPRPERATPGPDHSHRGYSSGPVSLKNSARKACGPAFMQRVPLAVVTPGWTPSLSATTCEPMRKRDPVRLVTYSVYVPVVGTMRYPVNAHAKL